MRIIKCNVELANLAARYYLVEMQTVHKQEFKEYELMPLYKL